MAISSLISPSGEISIQDSLWHIASSTNSGQTDMKYVFDVYNGNTQLVRVKVYPEPSNGKGYFDASRVVKNEITYDWFQPNDVAFLNQCQPSTSGQIALTYNIRVGEDVSGVTTTNMASGNTTAYNFTPLLYKRRKMRLSDYDNKFMTNRSKLNIRNGTLTNRIYIPFKSQISNPQPVIDAFGFNNQLLFSRSFSINQNPTGNQFMQFDVGGKVIQTTLNGNPRNLADDVNYYEISFLNIGGEKIRVYLDCAGKYTPMPLHFMNSYGMFETAIFKLVSKLTMDIERKTYQTKEYEFNGNSVDYYDSKNVYHESKINYNSKINWKYKLTYDYPSDQDYQWLAELIMSPQIFIEIDDNFYPVTIVNTNYEYSQNINNGLKELQIDIEMNQPRFGFRR
jgi:hypothetical protein